MRSLLEVPVSIPLRAEVFAEAMFSRNTSALASARRFIEGSLESLPGSAVADIVMAVDEAFANVLEHACMPPGAEIALRLYLEDGHVRVILNHPGIPFDGNALAEVDLESHRQARRTGGLGVCLMKRLMDRVLFRSVGDGRQELVMVKHCA